MALSLSAFDLYWNLDCLCIMGRDRPTFDATSADCRRAFKFFVANFRDFCIMEDYINPAKPLDSEDCWITAKRPKAMAALPWAFPQAEWDVLTTTIDSQISDDEKQNPAQWLTKLSQHYLGREPLMQSTHNFLCMLKQEPGMSIQAWHTLMRLEYQKCNFPSAADDRLQRDIFVIGLNDSFRRFRSDMISRDLTSLTFAQVISKASDFEASTRADSAITQQPLDEVAHKITSNGNKSKWPSHPSGRSTPPASGNAQSNPCIWCGCAPHANRRDCPASNDICHGCGRCGHWQQVCRASSARMVSSAVQDSHSDPQPPTYHITHDVYQVSSAPKGIFVNLDLSPPALSSCPQRLRFQVDSGCSCNTILVTDLNKLSPVQVDPSTVRLLDYSKAVIPTSGQTTLQCTHRGETEVCSSNHHCTTLLCPSLRPG